MPRKILDLAAGKGHECVCLEKVKHTLPEKVGNDADVGSKVEAFSEVDAFITVLLVVHGKRRQHTELNLRGIAVLLNGANDLDGTSGARGSVDGFNHFAERALAQKPDNIIYFKSAVVRQESNQKYVHRLVSGVFSETI